ncbi:hypothetical protein Q6253_28090, partial [Klebsiella quasipneumoniae]|nr:hypothetical protein [Klebsiella quasipneumoniae]
RALAGENAPAHSCRQDRSRQSSRTRFPTLAASPLEQIESLEQLRVLWHGERIAVHVSEQRPGPGVDTPEDLERVRRLIQGLPRP